MAERQREPKRLTDKQLLSVKYRLFKATGGKGAVWNDVALLLGHIVVVDVRQRASSERDRELAWDIGSEEGP